MASITFQVSDVEVGELSKYTTSAEAGLRRELGHKIEAYSRPEGALLAYGKTNMLAAATQAAFYEHYSLTLSPDSIWLCLAKGFALHVNEHAEALRGRLVRHQGKAVLEVRRPDFSPGAENPWPEVFSEFSDQIAGHVGKLREVIVPDFSTTGPTERLCAEVMLMDTLQAYFDYQVFCGCGIPAITLLGTPADWRSLRARAAVFAEYGLDDWLTVLDPILGKLVETSEGKVDVQFWRSFFHEKSMSGGDTVTGWLLTLFPYLERQAPGARIEPNPFLRGWSDRHRAFARKKSRSAVDPSMGPSMSLLPAALGSAPLRMFWGSQEASFRIVGGLLGVRQDPETRGVAPVCGWALLHDGPGAKIPDENRWK